MPPIKQTPADHIVHPDCPNDEFAGHGYWRAHRRGCICPGESYTKFIENHLRAKNLRNESRRAAPRPVDHVNAPDFWSPDVPEPADLGRETRIVLNSDNPACKDVDPELFFPVGTGDDARAQIKQAKVVCGMCPLRTPCLRAALDRDEQGIWGGLTYEERREARRRRLVGAA